MTRTELPTLDPPSPEAFRAEAHAILDALLDDMEAVPAARSGAR